MQLKLITSPQIPSVKKRHMGICLQLIEFKKGFRTICVHQTGENSKRSTHDRQKESEMNIVNICLFFQYFLFIQCLRVTIENEKNVGTSDLN